MEKKKNPICEHGMEAKRENKDTQKYTKNYYREHDEIDMQLIRYTDDSKV
jgi:hypothetical protein